jgi:hypothetical protein
MLLLVYKSLRAAGGSGEMERKRQRQVARICVCVINQMSITKLFMFDRIEIDYLSLHQNCRDRSEVKRY